MNNRQQKIKAVKTFFLYDLWTIDTKIASRVQAVLIKIIRIIYLVATGFIEKKCLLRASALTYSTMLSIVPLFALIFSMAKGFGVQNKLEPLLIDSVTGEMREVAEKLMEYVANTDVKALGTVGFLVLIFSVINVLGNIEKSFNEIWGISKNRPFFRKFSDYISVLLIGPILVVAATGITATLSNNAIMQKMLEIGFFEKTIKLIYVLAPSVSLWIAFTALYLFMPNTKVKIVSAFASGIFAGTLWQLSQWGYIYFQVGVSKYNAIYGTFATLPIFMVWLYISWIIVLLGAKISYVCQNLDLYLKKGIWEDDISFYTKELLSLSVSKIICQNFYLENSKKNADDISEELDVPINFINTVLHELCEIGVLTEVTTGERPYYLPATSPENIKVQEILMSLRKYGEATKKQKGLVEHNQSALKLLSSLEQAQSKELSSLTLKDFSCSS